MRIAAVCDYIYDVGVCMEKIIRPLLRSDHTSDLPRPDCTESGTILRSDEVVPSATRIPVSVPYRT